MLQSESSGDRGEKQKSQALLEHFELCGQTATLSKGEALWTTLLLSVVILKSGPKGLFTNINPDLRNSEGSHACTVVSRHWTKVEEKEMDEIEPHNGEGRMSGNRNSAASEHF